MDSILGRWVFAPFNRFFSRLSDGLRLVGALKSSVLALLLLVVYMALLALTGVQFANTPTGYVPGQDKQYLVAFCSTT